MTDQAVSEEHIEKARAWLSRFEESLATSNKELFDSLFLEESYWRDLVSFTWNFRQAHGREAIGDLMWAVVDDIKPSEFKLDENRPAPSLIPDLETPTLEVFFAFKTAVGKGTGIVQLVLDPQAEPRAFLLFTQLVALDEVAPQWPKWDRFDLEHPGVRWNEHLEAASSFEESEPDVLLVGGGQFGVMTAAHMARLGVNALIVDKHPRVGDAWRSRYESLILHQPHGMLYFSFLKFPENFPEYIPKDKFADWFEAYVKSLDLNFWTSTEFVGGTYDEELKRWDARVKRADGSIRTLHPKHIVMTTGSSDIPNIPDLEGLDDFAGPVQHSKQFRSGRDFAGKNVLVVGVGTSAHDIALDVVNNGGQATLLQRNPLIVVDLPTANMMYGEYNGRTTSTELLDDRYMAGMIYPLMDRNFKAATIIGNEADAELHRGLEAAGMKLTSGPENAGWFMRYFRTAGGYYINVGASDAIIRGDIKVRQESDVERFVSNGIKLKSGEVVEFDAVMLATGYKNQRASIERDFGKDVADRVGDIWGFDAGGETRNGWKPTAQEGLWIMTGGVAQARWYAPHVTLMIKAELEGIVPESFKKEGHPSRTPADTEAFAVS